MQVIIGFAIPEVAKPPTPALRARLRFAAIIPPSAVPHQCTRVALPAWGRGQRLSLPGTPCSSSEHLHLHPCFKHPCCIAEGGLIPSFSPMGAEACRAFLPQPRPRRLAAQQPKPKDDQSWSWEGYFRSDLPWYERYLVLMARQPPVVPPRPKRLKMLGKLARRVKAAVAGSAPAQVGGANADRGNDPFENFDGVTEFGIKEIVKPEKAAPFPKVEIKKANTVSLLKEVFIAYALRPAPVTGRDFGHRQPILTAVNMKSAFSTYGSDDGGEDNGISVYSQSASLNSNLTEVQETGNVELRALSDSEMRIRRRPGLLNLGNLRTQVAQFSQIQKLSPVIRPTVNQKRQEVSRIMRPVDGPAPPPIYLGRPLLLPSLFSGGSLYLGRPPLRGSGAESSIGWERDRVDDEFRSLAVQIIQQDIDLQNGEQHLAASSETSQPSNVFFTGRLLARRARRFSNRVKRTLGGWARRFFQLALGKCGGV
ncbi:hypothetical protein V2W45_1467558 [Cenococcum geophilum]